ncbi:MAG: hypothetical protein JWP57_4529 [Spirosoma sp.]|nr:hypothetical protein [Spirosoma sp.]
MDNGIKLEGGKLLLFQRNGIWQARVYLGKGRYLWRSLDTSSEADARRAGLRLFHQTEFKLAEGLPIQLRTLNTVIDEYVAARELDNKQGTAAARGSSIEHTSDGMLRQVKRVVKFWRAYAGSKAIEAVDDMVLEGFVVWRKAYYHDMPNLPKNARINPTDKTLQWEIMLGKALVKFAHRQGYRGNKPLPTFTFVPKIKRVRPAFGSSDFNILVEALPRYVEASTDERQRASRTLLSNYVLILAMSGMRVGELNSLCMRDLTSFRDDSGRVNLQFAVRGKTGKRIVVPRVDANRIIEAMLLYRKGTPDRDARLFVMPNGDDIATLADQFRAFLCFAKIEKNADDEPFTLYSLRHTYATRAIHDGVDIYTIARNMGTSVSIIEQYYGKHATSVGRATALGGDREEYEMRRRNGNVVAERIPALNKEL